MKKLTLAAALLMASTAAHAGGSISFEIDGPKIRVESPRNCDQLSCLKITGLNGINLNGFKSGNADDDATADAAPPAETAAPAQRVEPAAPPPASPAVTKVPAAPASPASTASNSAPVVQGDTPPAPAKTTAAVQPAPVAAAPASAPTTPLGVWATEENKGNVRIESCGANLCGYAEKSGEKILINMRPSENKWVGRIHDPDSGSNYDSTIAMKGPNALRVQGCAFGGLFCGGQTWKRVS